METSNPTPGACNVDAFLVRWKAGALGVEIATCIVGSVGSGLSLWCLVSCKRIKSGMKLQLCLFFSLLFLINLVAMPGAAVAELLAVQCHQFTPTVHLGQVALYTIAATMERNACALLAVYRFAAVCWPHKYQVLSHQLVVAVLNGIVLGGVMLLWLVVFLKQDLDELDVNNPSLYDMGRELYFGILLTPMVVAFVAYVAMISVITYRKHSMGEQERERPSMREQVYFAVGVLIVINLLLDGPHIILHLMGIPSKDLAFIVIHVVYRLHFALDPIIFIGLNAQYRRKVLLLALPGCSLPVASNTGESSIRRIPAGGVARPDDAGSTV
ncbi:uncharacterized protein LOC122255648 [Penaeus japonicus]|uniref:uncharacterized protein LOC122255648 n=1 Tax=Penaeus japonicus TaxID=27405 RepID=UPI001C711D2D|nr:uncharacterized protein LOC122255648 [Penaeus japonicus]